MSNFDNLVEQVAFGHQARKATSSVGLYLSPGLIYLAETHLADGKLTVDHLVRIPLPLDVKKAAATATMSTEFLIDPEKIAEPIKQSMSQLKWSSKSIRVTLSHHFGLLRIFPMPAIEHRFLHTAVPLEAKKYIPIPLDTLTHDFKSFPLPPDASSKQRLGILMAMTQKNNIANVKALASALEMELSGLEVAPLSVERLWLASDPPESPAPYAQVHIDGGNVRVLVAQNGIPVFFREVFLPSEPGAADLRRIDLPGCITFVQKQLGFAELSEVRLSGQHADLEMLKNAFANETNLPCSIRDITERLSVKEADWEGYAAIGCSAESLSPTDGIDLSVTDQISEEERRTARDILIAGSILALIFAGIGLFKTLTYTYRAQELHLYEKKIDPQLNAELASLKPDALNEMVKGMQKQLVELRHITKPGRPKISAILKGIIDVMPEKIWLDRLSVANPLNGNESNALRMTLFGHAQDQSIASEQDLAFQFKDNLVKDAVIGANFDINISLKKEAESSDGSGITQSGMDPKSLAQKLEERTSFTLELRSKK